ncbi:M48 family metalloprotease [Streptomyces sp. NPDC046805]|uniref:M48 family metalloprotease n=1 Tax=Streptomyces sp. NPDC046805 TaxID=3155134 RepID=UPI0033E326CC
MSAASAPLPRPGRPDEHVLGPGTGSRFALLVVLFLTSSATVASTITHSLTDPHNIAAGCALAAGADPGSDFLSLGLVSLRSNTAYQACLDRFAPHASPWWPPLAVAVLVLAAGALYWSLPWWKERRGRVVPLEVIDRHGELNHVLEELVGVAGLARRPRFVVAPAARTASAVVFGRWRRYTVSLHGGLVASRHRDPEGFRAVVLHELAHIRNRDIDITYGTVALWRVFLTTVLPAYVVWSVLDLRVSLSSAVLGPSERLGLEREVALTAAMLVFVFLARADILRTREIYADADAMRWGADPAGWQGATDRAEQRPGRARAALRGFATVWRTHPVWDRRRESLADPKELFRPSALTLFLTGAMASICAGQLYGFGTGPVVDLSSDVVAGLIATTAGVSLWRAAARAVLTGDRAPSGLRAGWWLGLGLMIGELLVGTGAGLRLLPRHPEVLALLVLISLVVMCWTAQFADLALRCWRGRGLRTVFAVGLLAMVAVFALWYAWWQTTGKMFVAGWPFENSATRQILERTLADSASGHDRALGAIAASLPLVLPVGTDVSLLWAVAAMWLLPLMAWAIGPSAGTPRWAMRALPDRGSSTWSTRRLPSFRRLAMTAAAGSVAACAAAVALAAWLHAVRPPDGHVSGLQLLLLTAWLTAVLAGVVVVTAVVAGASTSRFPVPAAVVAAGTAGLAGVTAAFLLTSADGCVGALSTLGTTCRWLPEGAWPLTTLLLPLVLGLAVFLSAGAAVAAMGVRRLWRACRRNRDERVILPLPQPPGRKSRSRPATRRAGVAVICLTVLALSTAASLPLGGPSTARTSLTIQSFAPLDAIPPPSSPAVLALQSDAWLRLGGRPLMVRFTSEFLHIVTALEDEKAYTDRGFAARRIRPHCLELRKTARQLDAYFPLPDPTLEHTWSPLLRRAMGIGADCRRAIDEGKVDLYSKAMQHLLTIVEPELAITQKAVAEAGVR